MTAARRQLERGLLVVAAGLVCAIILELAWPLRDATVDATPPATDVRAAPIQVAQGQAAAGLEAFEQRPLFRPDRRPEPAIAAPVAPLPQAAAAPQYELVGIVAGRSRQIAVLRDLASSQTVRVTAGTHFGSVEVRAIQTDHVVLVAGGREQTITFNRSQRGPSSGMPGYPTPMGFGTPFPPPAMPHP
jgi:type II secretory pathway component PulC